MLEEKIRASEEELLVFISSRQDEEMACARRLAIEAVEAYPGLRVWAFEDAPASSESARAKYIRNAGKADFVIWLIGSTTTTPVAEEVDACLRAKGILLPFLFPADQRDFQTKELIERVQRLVTWRKIQHLDTLAEHIKVALTDEMVKGVKDPAPFHHDAFLENKLKESISETKRLWTTLGVPDGIAQRLANNRSIGHKLDVTVCGMLQVMATQGSGKTLAAHRLYQHALANRLENHLQPLPVLLQARNIGGELKDSVEKALEDQGSVYTQRVLIIIDGLDEVGRYEANRFLGAIESFTEANQNAQAVVMTRPLPGVKSTDRSQVLPECTDDEFLSIASRIAGRTINDSEIPYPVLRTRIPLLAVILGTHFRSSNEPLRASLSEMVSQLVQRILQETQDYPEDIAEPLKKLAIASINAGTGVRKAEIDPRASVHANLIGSRLVVEENGKFDFSLAIFREWFAARALVEKSILPSDIELTSDRWVIPLAISLNSENPSLAAEIMEAISTKDPGIASLVLEEVKSTWSVEESTEDLPSGTALEIGRQIRRAMLDWREGLGSLKYVIEPTSQDGSLPTLAVGKGPGMVTTLWYRGEEQLDPVVAIPSEWNPTAYRDKGNWHPWSIKEIKPTRAWPWTTTKEDLSSAFSELLKTYSFALCSTIGIGEFTSDFCRELSLYLRSKLAILKDSELTNWIDKLIDAAACSPGNSVRLGRNDYTVSELQLVRAMLSELRSESGNIIADVWPGKDKPWPEGRASVWWGDLYSETQLLKRTIAIFDGALRIYDDFTERWFQAFNKRGQLSYKWPLRIEGTLSLRGIPGQRKWGDAFLTWWSRPLDGEAGSGVFIELESEAQALGAAKGEKMRTAADESLSQNSILHYVSQVLPGNDPRPATKLAHDWLTGDLKSIGWL